jgi:hypothetical protein
VYKLISWLFFDVVKSKLVSLQGYYVQCLGHAKHTENTCW